MITIFTPRKLAAAGFVSLLRSIVLYKKEDPIFCFRNHVQYQINSTDKTITSPNESHFVGNFRTRTLKSSSTNQTIHILNITHLFECFAIGCVMECLKCHSNSKMFRSLYTIFHHYLMFFFCCLTAF